MIVLQSIITLGLCLPSSCTESEITQALQEYFDRKILHQQQIYNMSIKIEDVKRIADDFQWLEHPVHLTMA